MKVRGLYIGGLWTETESSFPVWNPATGHALADVPLGNTALLHQATTAAYQAFLANKGASSASRSDWLQALSAAIAARAETFAITIQKEAGKPIALARAEVRRAQSTFTLAAEAARNQQGSVLDLDAVQAGAGYFGMSKRFPLGVVAALTPFNFPLNLAAHKVAPALAAGNSVVLKPSPRTPLTALLLAEAAEAAGIPKGLFNVVTCPNEDIAGWLENPLIRMLSFTGSGPVGRSLHAHARGRRCTLELGGNAAVLVHSDADLEEAVPRIASGGFAYSGQSCISVQRVLVDNSLYDEARERLLTYTREQVPMGDPGDPNAVLGPMIDELAAERAEAFVTAAARGGASVLCGGTRTGAFLSPTIVEGAPNGSSLVCDEIFAPVLCLERYGTFDEAIAMVNASSFGLQTGIFTNDFQLGWKAFNLIETGAVLLNEVPTWRTENMPYGGVKASGLGREGVRSAMEEMSEPRSWIWRSRPF